MLIVPLTTAPLEGEDFTGLLKLQNVEWIIIPLIPLVWRRFTFLSFLLFPFASCLVARQTVLKFSLSDFFNRDNRPCQQADFSRISLPYIFCGNLNINALKYFIFFRAKLC